MRPVEPPIFPDIETVALKGGNSVIALSDDGKGARLATAARPAIRRGGGCPARVQAEEIAAYAVQNGRERLSRSQEVAGSNPVAPTILQIEPFGENVEGLSLCQTKTYVA